MALLESGAATTPAKATNRYRMPDADEVSLSDSPLPEQHRAQIEPWLSAMFQAEHLSLLLGNGFTMGTAYACHAKPATMDVVSFPTAFDQKIRDAATASALRLGRGPANFEDQLRAASELHAGLTVWGENAKAGDLSTAIATALQSLLLAVLEAERGVEVGLRKIDSGQASETAEDVLGSFLMSFGGRSSSRERLNLFTTNYDRLIEFGCERVGFRIIDRFVGTLSPIFRSSRLDIDLHYNPPGIRGEPRVLEGVVRFAKLHGSVDWRFDADRVRRTALPFGAAPEHPEASGSFGLARVIYPNASKDIETSEFPYAELFRDFSASLCRPNSVLTTYGYGFGDSHVNAIIRDMLTIPSTHLVIISFDEAGGRIAKFINGSGHQGQISYLIGDHFGDLRTLVHYYLPKPAIEKINVRRTRLLQDRGPAAKADSSPGPRVDEDDK